MRILIDAPADVGGFFGNPDPEILVLGVFNPFFRAHAHIDTKRREPYLLDDSHKNIVRSMICLRYALLPVRYTTFREASVSGVPVLRPHYVAFLQEEAGSQRPVLCRRFGPAR
jgi:alpha 1,3-glucosidase